MHEDVLRLSAVDRIPLKFDRYVVLKMADGPDWRLDNDKKTITVTFPTEPPMSYKLQTSLVDDLLRAVGMLRANMLPERRYEDLTHTKNESIVDPRCVETLFLTFAILAMAR